MSFVKRKQFLNFKTFLHSTPICTIRYDIDTRERRCRCIVRSTPNASMSTIVHVNFFECTKANINYF
ncbi:hypothetical protein [Lambdina fiscellaria nucleopolyhedrovirus]|uniref:Uncharacterized protein n=1 Tax=Lambdina fiscellaria nucleopolyhedrovirus TaxID=1642929 RepID=A0A0E3Z7I3_9ABAC|nr:hypothetical protein [Lambdina fiscellaria nucleopolyhedrovirus]AKC91761.1 hypothetical protein [Lambdina fiscellaria nucleopolyhedrovirus]